MARAKGMLNLSGNIEVLAGAPFDARELVPTKADLTVASNFPYPYVGMETYVTAEDKKYRYMGGDITDLSNWAEVGSGGGQTYNDFTGATASTAGAHGLVPAPSAGDEGKVLFGNGLWGALPSVDLSVLSNEAFILDTNEKVVGMAPNRKLLYAKTIDCGAGPNNNIKTVATGISNFEKGWMLWGTMKSTNPSDIWCQPLPTVSPQSLGDNIYVDYNAGNIRLYSGTNYSSGSQCDVTIFYTKTTDSPLPSDEKFAGVTASGEVILKTDVTLNNASFGGNWQWYDLGDVSSLGASKLIDAKIYTNENAIVYAMFKISNGHLYGAKDGSAEIQNLVKATLYYTKSSS